MEAGALFLNCSINKAPKTDACTNCYSDICDTCQVRQDFLHNEVSSKHHSSEFYVDQIYTCNKCDQSWMDKFSFCFTCGRIVCESFLEEHEKCPDIHTLVKSDVIRRRRLTKTLTAISEFEGILIKDSENVCQIRTDEEMSQLLPSLNRAFTCLQIKINETIDCYTKDSEIFQEKLSGVDLYINQQMLSLDKLKKRIEKIKTDTFPVSFLKNITEWEVLFKRLTQNQSKLDLSGLRNSSIANVECQSVDYDTDFINSLLGVCGKKPETDVQSSESNNSDPSGSSTSTTSNDKGGRHRPSCSATKRYMKGSTESAWYSNHLLKKEIASKNEQINKLETKCGELKKRLQLTKQSRDAAITKRALAEQKLVDNVNSVDGRLQQLILSHEYDIEQKETEIETAKAKLIEVQEEIKSERIRHSTYVTSMMSEIEALQQKLCKSEDMVKSLESQRVSSEEDFQTKIERYQLQYDGLKQDLNLRIRGLEDHISILEKDSDTILEKDSDTILCNDRLLMLQHENTQLKDKLGRIRAVFKKWTEFNSGCVSAMGRELNEFETCADLKEENRQLKEKLAAIDKTRKVAKDLLDVKPDDTAHGDDITEEPTGPQTKTKVYKETAYSDSKRITSVSYTAETIHIIQNSQVSLADSGYDAKSLFGDHEHELEV